MEIVSAVVESLVSKIAELSAEPVIKQFTYMFCSNNFVKKFSEQWRSLDLALHRVQHDVDVAIRNAEEIYDDVNKWLEDAKKALAVYGLQDAVDVATKNAEEIEIDVNKWLEDAKNEMEGENRLENEKGKNGKCFTWCPKWICQFKLSKALEKKTETLRKLEEESKKFQKVGHKEPPQDVAFLPSKDIIPSESSKEAFEQIMKALKDDNVNMIGLHGMGGVGKTTLVEEVGRRAKDTQLFDEVLLATVSQNPNVMSMQDRMAESLGLKFDEKAIEMRAGRLWKRLETVKKLLVILDDVWQDVNLKKIGIPFGDDHRGCKVLLTTRDRDICSSMECQPLVFLGSLSENEAWDLFKINAGLRDEDSNLNTVAKEAARECKGLPIALVTVGRALRGKSVVEWEVATTKLKNNQLQHMERNGEQKSAYGCLKLSYDYLKHEETKLCFLLCCLFPEDYDISIEDLTRYAFGYGLYQDVESIEDARKHIYVEIKTLKDCCMLLGTETEKHVKMHDLVRDVAIQIASKEHGFMVKAGIGLKEWPRSNKSFEGCTTISLMGNKLAKLPEELVCPQLKVLLLELDYDVNVPERFFEGMKEIEVLSLTRGCLSLQSLEFSMNLKSLLLICCQCNDLIWLRKLQRLEILGFIWCSSLEELPDEIGELKKLRLLDVTGCRSLRRIPVNLIGRLKKLEELLIGDYSFKGWGVVGCDSTGGMNASLTELNLLSDHLAALSLKIPSVECIPRDFVFPRLLRYDIMLGDGYSGPEHPNSTRLYLCDISAASLNAKTFEQLFPTVSQIGFIDVEGLENIAFFCDQMTSHGHGSQKDFLQRLEDVKVKGCRDTRTMFPAKWRQALNNLTSVEIDDCESLEVVFELGEAGEGINEEKELRLLSSLTRLELSSLPELKCIWKGPTRHVSLRSLIHLELRSLHKLTFIFTPHLAQNLVHLETLRIDYCRILKHLIREKDDEREIIQESLGFPKLKTLSISDCDKLEYVFPVSVSPSLLNLEEMAIEFGANLKQIFYRGEGDALTRDGIINFPQQRELSLSRPTNFTVQLPSLQVLAIKGHEELGDFLAQLQGHTNLREIRITDCKGAQDRRTGHELSILRLEKLELTSMPDMRCIWKGLVLSHLTYLKVSRCQKLTHVFTGSMVASLVQLQSLDISDCSELEQIIAKDKDEEREIIQDSLGFPKLKTLSIHRCEKLECVFPVSVSPSLLNLEEMEIEFGANLKQIFYSGEGDALTRDGIINFPQLRKLCLSSGCNFFGPKHFTAQLPSLKVLAIDGHEELGDLLAQLQGHTNLREICITYCTGAQDRRTGLELSLLSLEKLELNSMPDMRCIWKGLVLSHLTSLEVSRCEKLTHVFTGRMVASLVQLQCLRISDCSELEQIIAKDNDDEKGQILSGSDLQSLCFPNLSYVNIWRCNKLRSIFPVAMAAGLPKLKELVVRDSSQLLGVFGQDDDASPVNVEKQMVLRNLSFLKLDNLPSLVCFSLGCDDFLFPRLGNPMVDECPKLTTKFANTTEGHINLREIRITDCKGAQDRRTGHELSNLSLEKLELTSIPDMRCIWKGLVLSHLTTLKVSRCEKLTHVFTGSMVASLVQLKIIVIVGCSELEQIIAKEKDDEREIIQDSLGFPKLKTLSISDCDKLEYVFPVSVSPSLLNLEEMNISFGANLKQIFYSGEGDALTRDGIIKFPQLRELSLKNGCNVFGPKHFTAQFPSLQELSIHGHEELGDLLAQLQGLTNLRRIYITSSKGAQHLMQAGSFVPNRRTGHEWWQALKNLATMKIEHCGSLEEVFELGEAGEGINEEKELLSSLTRLELKKLPELKCIWKGPTRHVSLRSLVHLELRCIDKLTFIFTPHLAQSLGHLETLQIDDCGELKQLISEKDDEREIIPESPGIRKLKTLSIRGCDKLEYVFPVSVSPSLLNLEEMNISFGANLKQIFYSGEGDALTRDGIIKFPQLRELSLKNGCNVFGPKHFTAQFPSLQELSIHGHEELGDLLAQLQGLTNLRRIYITSSKGAQHLMQAGSFVPNRRTGHEWWQALKNLATMKIEHCGSLEEVFELGEAGEGINEEKELLSSLTRLELKKLPELKCIWKGPTRHVSLRSLVHLELRCIDKLTFIFTPHLAQSLVHLETLQIDDCGELKHLISEKDDEREIIPQSPGFRKLKTLSIRGCDKLEYVFPVSVSPSLLNLEEMNISFGANLKQIFYSGEGDALTRDGIIKFPQLRELSLKNGCNVFGPKHFTAQFPSLQELSIHGHEELGDLLAQLQGLTNLRRIYITSSKGAQHLMQAGSFVPNRRTGHEWWQALKNLATMKIEHCGSLEEVFELGEAGEGINEEKELLSSLTRLELKKLPELKCIWKGPTRHVSLRSLVHLELRCIDKLTFIFTPHLAQSLGHLETLQIDDCGELKQLISEKDDEREIIPESPGFRKLKTLSIRGCDKLEYVFPVSVSPSLLNLEEMNISFGANLKQIFYSGEGDALTRDGIIKFPQLRKLSLKNGCNVFGPKHFTAQFPSLQELSIHGHEELGDLLAQLQGLTNLREIRITKCKGAQELMQVGSFGTNGRTGHELSLLSLEKLELKSLPDMRCIWKGLVLSHLTTLEVRDCEKLTHVFTGSMVASLVQLESLYISDCEELEQIIAKDNDDEKDQILSGSELQSLCFPNIEIDGCNKLRSLFPVAMAAGLPKLKDLDVRDSSQLLGVFGKDDDASPVNVEKQMEFPNLSILLLCNLPSLVCFSLGCDDLSFPNLRMGYTVVVECPKLTTKFPNTTDGSWLALSDGVSLSSSED